VNTCTEETIFVSYTRTTASLDHVRDLRSAIESVSRLRYTLAHEDAHLVFRHNATGMSGFLGILRSGVDEWRRVALPPSDAILASTALDQHPGHGFVDLPGIRFLLALQEDVFSPDSNAALLRMLDGILAALCLMLVLVLAALAQRPDGLTFVLVMLAACLRYGRREEPDDYAFLPKVDIGHRQGSSPQD
jgi:hypothetical protein